MRERLSTPDVLGNLMSDNKEVSTESNKKINPELPQEGEIKEKATFNLPVDLLNILEEKWMEIRKLMKTKRVSKTLLVEVALEMAFVEFNLKKQESNFYSIIYSNIETKK